MTEETNLMRRILHTYGRDRVLGMFPGILEDHLARIYHGIPIDPEVLKRFQAIARLRFEPD